MKKINWITIPIILIVLLGLFFFIPEKSELSGETIKFGWIGPQTGPSAVLGMDSVVAVQIAVDEINESGGIDGRKIELYIEDDQYDASKTLSAYQKLVDINGVKIIINNSYSGMFALADKAEQDNVIIIDPLDCNNTIAELNDNMFCLATDSESLAKVLSTAVSDLGLNKVAIMNFNSDLFMPLVHDIFIDTYDGSVVLDEPYAAGTRDFRTPLLKAIDSGVDALVLLGYDETGNAMKQARDLGYVGPFFTTGTVTSPPLQEAAQGNAEGTYLAFWTADKNNPKTVAFLEKFKDQQNRMPILDLATYPSYDVVYVLAHAIKNSESQSIDDVKKSILGIRDLDGITGNISFNDNGSVLIPEQLFRLRGGQVVSQ